MIRWIIALFLVLAACSDNLEHVPGSTLRYEQPTITEGTELDLTLFTNAGDCRGGGVSEELLPNCVPYVDRASGQVRLGFQFRYDSAVFHLPVTAENIEVYHNRHRVVPDQPPTRVAVIPHDPIRVRQVFILVIDGSGSMNEVDLNGVARIEKVRRALLREDVVDSFYPGNGVKTGVILARFTDGQPEPVGTPDFQIIENAGKYKKMVRENLVAGRGYTHLYEAVGFASNDLLKMEKIKNWILENEASPTIIALTDGFNNEQASDTCGSNAERLSRMLRRLKDVRNGEGVNKRSRPTVYAVGLGQPIRRGAAIREKLSQSKVEVSPAELCGRRINQRIDGDLERYGIDNASLEWMAFHGGGFAYVRQDSNGLAEAFKAAAAERYTWFELRYSVDPYYLRRVFETRVRLTSFATAEGAVQLHPSAWFDAPTGQLDADGWARPVPYRSTLVVLMPIFSGLLILTFIGAASFNTRRALFGRTRRPRPKASPAASGNTGTPPAPGSG